MGLTCASLHALTQGPSPAKQAINLDQVVQALAERLGYERADNPEEADRELIAVPNPGCRYGRVDAPGKAAFRGLRLAGVAHDSLGQRCVRLPPF